MSDDRFFQSILLCLGLMVSAFSMAEEQRHGLMGEQTIAIGEGEQVRYEVVTIHVGERTTALSGEPVQDLESLKEQLSAHEVNQVKVVTLPCASMSKVVSVTGVLMSLGISNFYIESMQSDPSLCPQPNLNPSTYGDIAVQ